jgi:hypothetical protein
VEQEEKIMKSGFRQIFTLLTLLLFSITVPAQDIPVLPDDPSVLKGVMPNGMSYYLISNAGVAGVADFALVQRTGRKTAPDSIASRSVEAARESLAYLPRLKDSSPHSYLSRHGVAPGNEGYVKVTDDATIFRFRDVTLSGTEVLDSTILVLMDMGIQSMHKILALLYRCLHEMFHFHPKNLATSFQNPLDYNYSFISNPFIYVARASTARPYN